MADVFVNCTREDTLSTINIEAQACGTRTIVFDVTGNKETVDGIYSNAYSIVDLDSYFRIAVTRVPFSPDSMQYIMDYYSTSYCYSSYVRKFVELN